MIKQAMAIQLSDWLTITSRQLTTCFLQIDERFEELISRSQLELYVSASHGGGSDYAMNCPPIKASVKQEFSSTLLAPTAMDETKESKKEVETFHAFFNPESTLSSSFAGPTGPVTSTSAQDSKRNLKITNVLSSNGKMVVFVPSIESRNSLKRLKPDFKPWVRNTKQKGRLIFFKFI